MRWHELWVLLTAYNCLQRRRAGSNMRTIPCSTVLLVDELKAHSRGAWAQHQESAVSQSDVGAGRIPPLGCVNAVLMLVRRCNLLNDTWSAL